MRSLPLVAAALLLALACSVALAADAPAVPVTVAQPQSARLTEQLRLSGTLTADRSAELSPRVDGLVSRLRVDAGDVVKRGQILLELDATVAQLALERAKAGTAEAAVQNAEAQRLLEEARRLVAERHLPATELARREAAAKLASAALDAARAAEREQAEVVKRHQLPAPFAGVVARRLTDLGEWVVRGSPVLELVATDRVRLDLQAPQERFARIKEDAPVEVQSALAPGKSFKGRITARVPVGDGASRTFLIRVLVEDAGGQLLPGTSATALIGLPTTGTALLVPRDALLSYPDGTYSVFVVQSSAGATTAIEKKVQIGRGGETVEVLDGLTAGEPVVIRGNERLRSGQPVRITGGT